LRDETAAKAIDDTAIDVDTLHAVETWAGEPLVAPGEEPAEALAPGTAFRRAYDDARDEISRGRPSPSPEWRRNFALLLGLQRMLAEQEPHLADGLQLRPHQVDALAGMLAALLGDAQRGWQDTTVASGIDEADNAEADDDDHPVSVADEDRTLPVTDDELADEERDDDGSDDTRNGDDDEDDDLDQAPPDPGAVRRYRFKHPTASGKTVAAAGFVDAARITGVLILTHRRLLVEQFSRDLRQHGYGYRLRDAVLRGRHGPAIPPVTIETYAWFIRNVDLVNRDVYGIVLCDEAHTALGDKTSAAIRSFDTPTYIGMTATDQLLQKHVGDVFPSEIDELPLAEAVRRGVVAPLRAVRVRPGASLKRVKIVGGDYDQQELAQALDHDALNMAAALYYRDMFSNKPGIVYSAGVDHAGRVAAAMRAVGLKAAAVSGRTPPRELATTLAAYERGEINVLVNAQLLAEGWNAPRATVCMHLAPTASRRVYQQRVGRIMRLHRRKEAGVVVDFAEPTAPHTDRTVTVHSLLGVDSYHPGALVTPRSPRRRQRWRRLAKPLVREAGWLVPVTSDPVRRREIILHDWKLVAIDKLPPDEQDMWAENAGRRVGQKDLQRLAKVLSAVRLETRLLFLATCAAENKNRQLRLVALGDLAGNRPPANVFDRAVRLVEAAPTWRLDRAQGARTLLLALGDHRVDASDHQFVAWAWRLGRASRDAQFRRVAAALENGRDLARGLAGKSGDELVRAAARVAATALTSPLDVGAALLCVVQTQDPSATRVIEQARQRLSEDALALAAALGTNVPLPRGPRRVTTPPRPAPTPVDATRGVEDAAASVTTGGDPPPKRKRRRRRRRSGAHASALVTATTNESPPAAADPAGDAEPTGEPPAPQQPTAPPAAREPSPGDTADQQQQPSRRRPGSGRAPAGEPQIGVDASSTATPDAHYAAPVAGPAAAATPAQTPPSVPVRRRRSPAGAATSPPPASPAESATEPPDEPTAPPSGDAPRRPRRSRRRETAPADAPAADTTTGAVSEPPPAAPAATGRDHDQPPSPRKRPIRRRTASIGGDDAEAATVSVESPQAAAADPASGGSAPAATTRRRRAAATASSDSDASVTVHDRVPTPTRRRVAAPERGDARSEPDGDAVSR
jgi:ribonuclease E